MYRRHLVATLVGILLLAACTTIRGSGTLKTESRAVSGFTAIDLSGSGHLTIEQTGTESLTIEAEDNILPLLTSDVSNGTLRLGQKNDTNILTTKTINYRLTVRDLNELTVSGSGEVTAPSITVSTFTVTLSGSGSMTLGGTADTQTVTISGSGRYDAAKLASTSVTIDISGSGTAVVMPSDTLNATIGGSGTLEYIGNPTVTQNISGSGRISKR
jgi:Putative auto-transporter adhesin, head GIN domain